jgi:molecular chaperone DnaK (HSP70)
MRIAIDIGTHTARAAYLDPAGQPQLIRLPSGATWLAALARQTMHGLTIGDEAARALVGNEETTIVGCTRLMGRAGQLPADLVAQLPYAVRESGDEAWCNLLYAEVRASDVYARIASELIQAARHDLGAPIESVVICVPASAEDRFRVQARAAIESVGVRVHRVINQPVAALLALGSRTGAGTSATQQSYVAVVASGGGTTEVSIASLGPTGVRTVAMCGDALLGGDDIVWAVAERLNERLRLVNGVDVFGAGNSRASAYGLRAALEETLRRLTLAPEALLTLDHGGGFGRDIATTLRRADVDDWTSPQRTRIAALCRRALDAAGLQARQIERVVVIGEWSWLPGQRESIAAAFERLVASLHTTDAAILSVYGAALAGAATAPTIWDVTPYPLGINCYYGNEELFSPIIAANTAIPTPPIGAAGAKSETYQTRFPNQTSVQLRVLQYRGERDTNPYGAQRVHPHECETLGTWEWAGLQPARGRHATFTVTFAVDADGILNLYAHEARGDNSGVALQVRVERGIG